MTIYPAIDLYGGKVVRLKRGEFSTAKEMAPDLLEVALRFREAGCNWIHVVDLEGAERGYPAHLSAIERLKGLNLNLQYGGGLRTVDDVSAALALGADRAMVGSLLFRDPGAAAALWKSHGEAILPAVDVKNDRVVISGWLEATPLSPSKAITSLVELGYFRFLVTSVEHDGMKSGPDLPLYRELLKSFPELAVIAAGGISSVEDIIALRNLGVEGAVIGKVVYERSFDLKLAIEVSCKC